MTPEQSAAFINAQTAMMLAELHGMIAENEWRKQCGNSIAYAEDGFAVMQKRWESVLGQKAIHDLFQQTTSS